MYDECTVLWNKEITPGFGRVGILAPRIAKEAKPGQFIMLKCWEGAVPFLMRPFSVNHTDPAKGVLEILYKIVGEGTKLLAALKPEAKAHLLGPLGSAFSLPDGARRIGVVGRGVGAAPLRALSESALDKGIEVSAYFSAGKEEYLFDAQILKQAGVDVHTSTDDNAKITDELAKDLAKKPFDAVYVCGSNRLMRATLELKKRYGFEAYASLEEHMACGIGACKGCICPTYDERGTESYARVCKEGPVFEIERLVKQA